MDVTLRIKFALVVNGKIKLLSREPRRNRTRVYSFTNPEDLESDAIFRIIETIQILNKYYYG